MNAIFVLLSIFLSLAFFYFGLAANADPLVLALFLLVGVLTIPCCLIKRKDRNGFNNVDLLQPGSMVIAFVYLYVLLPCANNIFGLGATSQWYENSSPAVDQLSLAIVLVSIISFGIGYRFRFNEQIESASFGGVFVNRARVQLLIFTIIIGLALKLVILLSNGQGLQEVLANLSPGVRARNTIGSSTSGFIILLASTFDWGVLVAAYLCFFARNRVSRPVLVLIICLVISLLLLNYLNTGKRSAILYIIVFLILWRNYIVRPLGFFKSTGYIAALVIIVYSLLMVRILVPLIVLGHDEIAHDIQSDSFSTYLNSGEIATYDMIRYTVIHKESILNSLGGTPNATWKYNFETMLVTLVPRFLWSGKPDYLDISHEYGLRFLDKSNVGIAVTLFGTTYLLYGLIGSLLFFLFFGAGCKYIYTRLAPYDKAGKFRTVFLYSLVYWNLFQYLRFGSLGFVWINFLHTQVIGLLLFLVILKLGPKARRISSNSRFNARNVSGN